MVHQYSRVGFNLSVEVNEVNLSLSYGGACALIQAKDYDDLLGSYDKGWPASRYQTCDHGTQYKILSLVDILIAHFIDS